LSRQMSASDPLPEPTGADGAPDDAVHVDQAAKVLGVSRRTVERMIDRGDLHRDTRRDSRVATVTKRSLVAALDASRSDSATRQSRSVSDAQPDVTAALAAIERLTDALADERRQLTAASVDRHRAEHEREEARVEAARLQAQLDAERNDFEQRAAAADAAQDELRAQLSAIASAGPIRALRLRRELRMRNTA
jgi:chromosome segregation ATPase